MTSSKRSYNWRILVLLILLAFIVISGSIYLGLLIKARNDVLDFVDLKNDDNITYNGMKLYFRLKSLNPVITIHFYYKHPRNTGHTWPRSTGFIWHARPWGEVVFDRPIFAIKNKRE